MKTKLLLSLLITSLVQTHGWGQYLIDYYKNIPVTISNKNNGNHIHAEAAYPNGEIYHYPNNVGDKYMHQNFRLEPGVTNNYYRMKHIPTGKYVTVIVSPGFAQLRNLGDCPNTDYQEFQFIQQTEFHYYKIHAHFGRNGLDDVLVAKTGTDNRLSLEPNQTTGNADDQRWYITNLNPPARPSLAIAGLEDRLENRMAGLTDNLRGFAWRAGGERIFANNNYAEYTSQFKLDYTPEEGWYRIRHKPSNKYVTVDGAYNNRAVRLAFETITDPDLQKFKFIWKANGKYEIHSKYTQGPEVGNNAALLLQLDPSDAGVALFLGTDNTAGANSDGWELFDIVRYENPAEPAQFDGGSSIVSGKITGKQYHITARESLAMLAPYIVGTDTFVRTQPTPIYGEQSEWIFDVAESIGGEPTYRVRYGKTGQYLYLPIATENSLASGAMRLKLKSETGTNDRRFMFGFFQIASTGNWNKMGSATGGGNGYGVELQTSDEGFLETGVEGPTQFYYYQQNRNFCINLSIPIAATNTFSIISRVKGHYMNDQGIVGNPKLIHSKYADYASTWELIPTTDGYHFLRNQLTKQYLTTNGNTSAGSLVYTGTNTNNNNTKWMVKRNGNFYNIQNVGSDMYLTTFSNPTDGGNVTQDIFPGTPADWVISRADYAYLAGPEIQGVYAGGILENYLPNPLNSLNNNEYCNAMMKNLGLPFEPSLQVPLLGIFAGNNNLTAEGFPTNANPTPSFLPVVKSALMHAFSYNGPRADSAIRNYKLDSAGHRIDVTYALKKYIIENLAPKATNALTANEIAIVSWLERKVKKLRVDYANKLEASWEDYKLENTDISPQGGLTFLALLGETIDIELFEGVDYFPNNSSKQTSLSEYAAINRGRNYKNPGVIETLTVPAIGGAGVSTLLAVFSRQILVSGAVAVENSINAAIAAQEIAGHAATSSLRTAQLSTRAITRVLSVGNVTIVASVALVAIEILATRAMQVAEYENFEKDLTDKINLNRNASISLRDIIVGVRLQDKIALNQDLDYLFGTGERFYDVSENSFTFTGSGNWNVAGNWLNNKIPPASVPNFGIINIDGSGDCIMNVPVTIPRTCRLVVKPGKQFLIRSTLIIPNLKIIQ